MELSLFLNAETTAIQIIKPTQPCCCFRDLKILIQLFHTFYSKSVSQALLLGRFIINTGIIIQLQITFPPAGLSACNDLIPIPVSVAAIHLADSIAYPAIVSTLLNILSICIRIQKQGIQPALFHQCVAQRKYTFSACSHLIAAQTSLKDTDGIPYAASLTLIELIMQCRSLCCIPPCLQIQLNNRFLQRNLLLLLLQDLNRLCFLLQQ